MELTHIVICVCTFRRPVMLARLLKHLQVQRTEGRFTCSIVVVDNDPAESARRVVSSFLTSPVPLHYDCEPQCNIAAVRNRCIAHARSALLAFIDDDEFPDDGWLLALFDTLERSGADGVLGPVRAEFVQPPPAWIVKGGFHEKGGLATGTELIWQQTRTSNVLMRRAVFDDPVRGFDLRFDKGGEDVDLFRRLIARGRRFVWCEEAAVTETIPPERCSRRYLLRRAVLRGQGTVKYSAFGARDLARSALALPAYSLALPIALLLGQHRFMKLLTKTVEHGARFLAIAGIEPIERYDAEAKPVSGDA